MRWAETGSDWTYISASIQKHVGQEAPDAEI